MSAETPQNFGRFRLEERLGMGGMGIIWRARHEESGQLAAVKTVTGVEPGIVGGIRREIRALAALDHPGIVRILEHGIQDGVPWYAMAWLHGETLSTYCGRELSWAHTEAATPRMTLGGLQTEAAPAAVLAPRLEAAKAGVSAPLAAAPELLQRGGENRQPSCDRLRRSLGIVHALCGTLAYVHGEGLVHRDLKPQNVMVLAGGRPVLIDFGLSGAFHSAGGRDRLEQAPALAGTFAYMAPEQILGEVVDARADLYAVGCILYELVTGTVPFPGEAASAMAQHLTRAPIPPRLLVTDLDPALDELIRHLLEKEPRRRVGHAGVIAAELEQLGLAGEGSGDGSGGDSGDGDGGETGDGRGWSRAPAPLPYLYRSRCLGREAALEELGQLLDEAGAGRGAVVCISGESGMGKTRLLHEIGRRCAFERVTFLFGSCLPGRQAALDGLREPLRQLADLCRSRSQAQRDELLGPRARSLAAYEPAFADLAPVTATPTAAAGTALGAEAGRLALYADLAEVLGALSADRTVVLALDDSDAADSLTAGFLSYVAERGIAEGHRLLVLTTSNSGGEDGRWGRRGPAVCAGIRYLALSALEDRAVTQMVGDMLALDPVPAVFGSFLARLAGGNPYFAAEYLRMAMEIGTLWRDRTGVWQIGEPSSAEATADCLANLPMPTRLAELVLGRLAALGDREIEMSRMVALLGGEASLALLATALGLAESALLDTLDQTVRRGILTDDGQGRVRFVHAQARALSLSALPDSDRRALHRRLGAAIESVFSDCLAAHAADLARQWDAAEERERCVPWYLVAARQARSRHAYEEARTCYLRYLELAGAGERATLVAVGNELAGTVLWVLGRSEEALALLEQSLGVARELGAADLEAETLRALGRVHWRRGELDRAESLWAAALVLARGLGDRLGEGMALGNLGILYHNRGRHKDAQHCYEQAFALAHGAGDRHGEATSLGNLAILAHERSEDEKAEGLSRRALAAFRALGDRLGEGVTLGNLADLARNQGRVDEARALYEAALRLYREVGDRRFTGIHTVSLASLERSDGNLALARALVDAARGCLRKAADPVRRMLGDCEHAHLVLEELGAAGVAEASAVLEQAQRLAGDLGAEPGSELGRATASLAAAVQRESWAESAS
ncbi:MAG: tetratricopeptide repeat protein [Candidatus Schekmanbacteria bacterium]|nr:tetratricopeptide repeat protein [Candidatus Schekmanbacteria bacterium]